MLKPEKVKISVKDVKFVDYLEKATPYSNHVTNLWCLTRLAQREFNTNFVIQAKLENEHIPSEINIEICLYKAYECHNRLYFKLNCNPYKDTVEEVLRDIYKILMNGDKLKEGDNIFEKYANLEIDTFIPAKIFGLISWNKIPDTNYDMFYKYFNKWTEEEDSRITCYKYL